MALGRLLGKRKTEPRSQGLGLMHAVAEAEAVAPYFACAFRAAISASLRKVITPILLSR
jgi:hypothetical protein